MYTILLYYKYIHLENPEKIRVWQRELCEKLGLKGRIIIASEGINGTVEGLTENTEKYIEAMKAKEEFADIKYKKSLGDGKSFPKLSIKVRKEIVTLGRPDIFPKPGETGAKYLSADELHGWFEKKEKDFVILDMRNNYELETGKFEKTVALPVRNFREIPDRKEDLELLKKKTVVAVCTGGVRCEKGTAYLKKELGFENIYQLHDGIVTYMEKYPQGYFKGSLYVFDNRQTMRTEGMPVEIIARCVFCNNPSENYINCTITRCSRQFIACEGCIKIEKGRRKEAICRNHHFANLFSKIKLWCSMKV